MRVGGGGGGVVALTLFRTLASVDQSIALMMEGCLIQSQQQSDLGKMSHHLPVVQAPIYNCNNRLVEKVRLTISFCLEFLQVSTLTGVFFLNKNFHLPGVPQCSIGTTQSPSHA